MKKVRDEDGPRGDSCRAPGEPDVLVEGESRSRSDVYRIQPHERMIGKFPYLTPDDLPGVEADARERCAGLSHPDQAQICAAWHRTLVAAERPRWLCGLGWTELQLADFRDRCESHLEALTNESVHVFFATGLIEAVSTARSEALRSDALIAVLFDSSEEAVRKVNSRVWGRLLAAAADHALGFRHEAQRFVMGEISPAAWASTDALLDALLCEERGFAAYRAQEKAAKVAERRLGAAWEAFIAELTASGIAPADVSADLTRVSGVLGIDHCLLRRPAQQGWRRVLDRAGLTSKRRSVPWHDFLARHPFGPRVLAAHALVAEGAAALTRCERGAADAWAELHRVVSEIEEISQVKVAFLDLVGSFSGRPRVVV
jgi:hypothetical protein